MIHNVFKISLIFISLRMNLLSSKKAIISFFSRETDVDKIDRCEEVFYTFRSMYLFAITFHIFVYQT